MGIPAAFRWLSNKYPKIISPVIEDQPVTMDDGTVIPVDCTRPNPNGEEFDNLYLDMNGIVHPCSHPEDRPPPKDEEEMMLEVFRYTDRVVSMVRPRKLLMIAVDGVAPRAKMNQQRSRRFRSAQEAQQKEMDRLELLQMIKRQNGGTLPPGVEDAREKKAFDSNSITPGTPFMDLLAASLRYWCAYKLNNDPAWAKMKVVISDATVPGEGEHKIMSFIRSQRASVDHDPNTRHVIYGLDADLIMLGLATHEPHFRVLREDVFAQESRAKMCKLCNQKGHEAQSCKGVAKEKQGEFDEKQKAVPLKPFIWLHVSVLREYLAVELDAPNLPFKFDLERALDDWVFMCCFVGNDFLPHLPALEIRENGIDTLTAIWRDNLPFMGGYVTKDGEIDLGRAQLILNGLAKQEDAIFRRRKEQEDRREAGFKRRKLSEQARQNNRDNSGQIEIAAPPAVVTHDMVVNRANAANKSAASVLKERIQSINAGGLEPPSTTDKAAETDKSTSPGSVLGKRKATQLEEDSASCAGPATPAGQSGVRDEPVDDVKLWEDGYADRYYSSKFHVDVKDIEFRHQVARSYVEGLVWVLLYYYQGCPSWEWFYPHHYAPFAQDFVDIDKAEIRFEKGRIARPFEQLMSVLPAASRHALPEVFHDLMLNEDSEVIDFYPEDFQIDLNGKKMAWQGVALLPFIEMPRLLAAIESKYPLLGPEDARRNGLGRDVLLLSENNHEMYDDITTKFYSKKGGESKLKLNPKLSAGLSGSIAKIEGYVPHEALSYPLDRQNMPDIDFDRSLKIYYDFPHASHTHKSMLLRGAKPAPPALTRSDIEDLKGKMWRSGRSHNGVPLSRGDRRQQFSYAPDGGQRGGPPPRYGPPGHGPPGYGQARPNIPPPGMPYGMPVPPMPAPVHDYNGPRDGYYNGPPPRYQHPPPNQSHGYGGGYSGGHGGYNNGGNRGGGQGGHGNNYGGRGGGYGSHVQGQGQGQGQGRPGNQVRGGYWDNRDGRDSRPIHGRRA